MRFPAFMFWPERYWLDTYDLSDAEHGRYLRILMLLWNTPRCHIPADPAWIATKTGRSVEAFETEIKPILLRFCKTDGGSWWQAKLLAEYERCERLSSRGRAGGNALAKKKKVSSQIHTREPQQAYAPTPTPTPTPTPKKEEKILPPAAGDGLLAEPAKLTSTADWPKDYQDQFWRNYPRKTEKKAALAKLDAIKKSGTVRWAALIGGLLRFVQHVKATRTEERYIKHPTTWLNRGCWDDEHGPGESGPDGVPRGPAPRSPQGNRGFAAVTRNLLERDMEERYGTHAGTDTDERDLPPEGAGRSSRAR